MKNAIATVYLYGRNVQIQSYSLTDSIRNLGQVFNWRYLYKIHGFFVMAVLLVLCPVTLKLTKYVGLNINVLIR